MVSQKEKMRKENQRRDMRKEKAKLTIDPRAKEKVTSSVTHVDSMGILPVIAGRTNKFERFLRTWCHNLQMQFQPINHAHRDHQVLLQVVVLHRFPVSDISSKRMFMAKDSSPLSRHSTGLLQIVEEPETELVFDLTSSACGDGSVRVVHFNIGDNEGSMWHTCNCRRTA